MLGVVNYERMMIYGILEEEGGGGEYLMYLIYFCKLFLKRFLQRLKIEAVFRLCKNSSSSVLNEIAGTTAEYFN
jgi:hypothetical protein